MQATIDKTISQEQFVEFLAKAITGNSNPDQTAKSECIDIFIDYIADYLEINYDKKEAIRFKATVNSSNVSAFGRFAEFDERFTQAYNSFLGMLETEIKNS
jgi:hypothetical protein